MKIQGLLLSFVFFAACGSRSAEEPRRTPETATAPQPPAPQPAPAQAPDNRPIIVAFGDSLSAGFGVETGFSYPDFLQRELDRRGYRYRVVNSGLSGDTTSGGLARVADVLSHKPAIVILELGGNDGLRGLPVSLTRSNLEQMIVQLQTAGIKVVLAGITLPPNYGADYIKTFDVIYRDLAALYKTPLIPFLLEGVALTKGLMQRDGLHPTPEGNRRVAETVMKTLAPLLKK